MSFETVYPSYDLVIAAGAEVSAWKEITTPQDSRDAWAVCQIRPPADMPTSATGQLEYADTADAPDEDAHPAENATGDLAPIVLTAGADVALNPVNYSVVRKYVRLRLDAAWTEGGIVPIVLRRV